MNLQAILTSPWALRWGAALLDSFWQGALVAALAWMALALARGARPQIRYLIACAALATLAILPAITFISTPLPAPAAAAASSTAGAAALHVRGLIGLLHLVPTRLTAPRGTAAAPDNSGDPLPASNAQSGMPAASDQSATAQGATFTSDLSDSSGRSDKSDSSDLKTQPSAKIAVQTADSPSPWAIAFTRRIDSALPWIVLAWLAGVALLAVRNLVGLFLARRLRLRGVRPIDAQWQDQFQRLCQRLKLRRAVILLESALVEAPSLVGWMKPAILMPACALTGFTPEQFEAVLAHELAHIRRHDYLVNLIQSIIETLLFHHPAVWWLSHRIRVEREYCCDDMVLEASIDRRDYAMALVTLEQTRDASRAMILAARGYKGGSLMHRIQRILGLRPSEPVFSARSSAGVLTLLGLAIAATASLTMHAPRATAEMETTPSPVAQPDSAAPANTNSNPIFTLYATGSDLSTVCDRLASLTGHAVHYPKELASEKVAVDAHQEELEPFLERLTVSKGWTWAKQDDGSYQILAQAAPGATPVPQLRVLKPEGVDIAISPQTMQFKPSSSPATSSSQPLADLKKLPGYVDFDASFIIDKADTRMNIQLDPLTLKMLIAGAQELDPEIKQVLTLIGLQSIRVQYGDGLPGGDDANKTGKAALEKISKTIAGLQSTGWSPLFNLNEDGDQLQVFIRPLDADNIGGIVVFYINDDGFGFGNVVGKIDAAELGKHLGSLTSKFAGGKIDMSQLNEFLEKLNGGAPMPGTTPKANTSSTTGTTATQHVPASAGKDSAGAPGGKSTPLVLGLGQTIPLGDLNLKLASLDPVAATFHVSYQPGAPITKGLNVLVAEKGSAYPYHIAAQEGQQPYRALDARVKKDGSLKDLDGYEFTLEGINQVAGTVTLSARNLPPAPPIQPATAGSATASPVPSIATVALKLGEPIVFNDVRLRLESVRRVLNPDGSHYNQIHFKVLGKDNSTLADVDLSPFGSSPLVQNRYIFSVAESEADAGAPATATIRVQTTNVPPESGASVSISEGAELKLPRATIHPDAVVAPGAAGPKGQAWPSIPMTRLSAKTHDATSTSSHQFTLLEHTSELVAGYEIRLDKATPGDESGMIGSASFRLVDLGTKNPK